MAIVKITSENFKAEVIESEKPVLLDFFATWCGPCKMLSPVLAALSEEESGVKFCKIDVDEERELAVKYGITSIPTLILIEGGEEKRRTLGYKTKEDLIQFI